MEDKLKLIRGLQSQFKDIYVTGSIALLMQGVKLGRDIGDIDLVKTEFKADFPYKLEQNHDYEPDDYHYRFEAEGLKVDLFFDDTPDWVSSFYKGHYYKIIRKTVILSYKLEYALKGTGKQQQDILYVLNKAIEDSTIPV